MLVDHQPYAWHVHCACRILARAGVIAYPTEAVWGLGCAPYAHAAIERILAMKRRPARFGLILIAARFDQLLPFMQRLPANSLARLKASWPGPTTWIVPAAAGVSALITGGRDTIAVRVTDHPLASALCTAANTPLISTSANVSGHPPARTALTARQRFGQRIDYVLPGKTGALRRPTQICDVRSGATLRAA